jgi:hypothetical protein
LFKGTATMTAVALVVVAVVQVGIAAACDAPGLAAPVRTSTHLRPGRGGLAAPVRTSPRPSLSVAVAAVSPAGSAAVCDAPGLAVPVRTSPGESASVDAILIGLVGSGVPILIDLARGMRSAACDAPARAARAPLLRQTVE